MQAVLRALQQSMKGVLQRNAWSSVFHKNGFGSTMYLRQSLLEALDWTSQPHVSNELPSHHQFSCCFAKKNSEIPYWELLSSVAKAGEGMETHIVKARPQGVCEDAVPWSARLRPRPKKSAPPAAEGDEVETSDRETETVLQPQAVPAVFDVVTGKKLSSVRPFPAKLKRKVSNVMLDSCTDGGPHSSAADL